MSYREVNMLNKPLPSIVYNNRRSSTRDKFKDICTNIIKGKTYSNPHYMLEDVCYTYYFKLPNSPNYCERVFTMFSNQKVLRIGMTIHTANVRTHILYPHYLRLSYC